MPREKWYESDDPNRLARNVFWRGVGYVIAAVLVIGVVGAVIWGIRVATSDVRGRGDVAIKVNAADNRLFAQGNFQDLYNEVISYDQRLDQAAADKAAHTGKPDESIYDTDYTGLVNQCIDTRNQYNAAARKISQAKFRDADLPYQLDPSDPRFDCAPSASASQPTPSR